MTPDSVASIIRECSDIFETNERISISDKVVSSALRLLPGNAELETVLHKVIIINAMYSTQVYSTDRIARHIVTLDADRRLAEGDLSLVRDLRHGHGIVKSRTGREIDFFSFATKYAAMHQPTKFPIVDSLVVRLLPKLNQVLNFTSRFRAADLKDYPTFVSIVNALISATGLTAFKYKRLDQGLWIWAKYAFEPSNLTDAERARLVAIIPSF